MTPYYQDDACTIYHGDCETLIREITCSVIVTDPPYGTAHYQSDRAVPLAVWDWIFDAPALALFGWPERLVALCIERQVAPSEWITWWPSNASLRAYAPKGLLREMECIAIFGFGKWESLRQSRTEASRRIFASNYPYGRGLKKIGLSSTERRVGDVWTDAAPGLGFLHKVRQHPNEKPVPLLRRLVEALASPDGTVLDPFMGSGTTLRAAKDLGRKAIGIEIEERYCEIAAKRLAQEVLAL